MILLFNEDSKRSSKVPGFTGGGVGGETPRKWPPAHTQGKSWGRRTPRLSHARTSLGRAHPGGKLQLPPQPEPKFGPNRLLSPASLDCSSSRQKNESEVVRSDGFWL